MSKVLSPLGIQNTGNSAKPHFHLSLRDPTRCRIIFYLQSPFIKISRSSAFLIQILQPFHLLCLNEQDRKRTLICRQHKMNKVVFSQNHGLMNERNTEEWEWGDAWNSYKQVELTLSPNALDEPQLYHKSLSFDSSCSWPLSSPPFHHSHRHGLDPCHQWNPQKHGRPSRSSRWCDCCD